MSIKQIDSSKFSDLISRVQHSAEVTLLPRNTRKNNGVECALFEHTTQEVKKLLAQQDINISKAQIGDKYAYISEKSADCILPSLMITYQFLIENPEYLKIIVGLGMKVRNRAGANFTPVRFAIVGHSPG